MMAEDGEKISKSELKRRLKAEKKAKEKAEKVAAQAEVQAATPAAAEKKKQDDQDIDPNEYFKLRSAAVANLKEGNEQPYPHKFHVSISLTEYIEKYSSLEAVANLKEGNEQPYPHKFHVS